MRKFRYIIRLCLLLVAAATQLPACSKSEDNSERSDYIQVFASENDFTPIDSACVSVKGGTYTYYIRSNAQFSAKWQSSDISWASIGSPKSLGDGLWSIDITVQPVTQRSLAAVNGVETGLYTLRYGVLMLTSKDVYLGKYFVVTQGLESRISCNFSWLYGSADPNATYNDVPMSLWTTAQRNMGFSSTLIDGEEDAWVYSKEGYVKLGNDRGAGADLTTPRTPDFQYDTLLVVSFKAVAQTGDVLPDYTGGTEPIVPMQRLAANSEDIIDDNVLTVEVTGGGYIRDLVGTGGTSLTFNIPYYNRSSPTFPSDIFDGASYLVFIEGTDSNPITVNTAVRFIAGSMKGSDDGRCNRVFIDDVFVYRIDKLRDEDLFSLNGGRSGKDTISGGTGDE